MRRRTLLAGIIGTGLLAGCTGVSSDTEGGSDTPESDFALREIDFPETVESNQEWRWSATIENTGTEPGTSHFHAFVRLPGNEMDHIASITLTLEPGEAGVFESPPEKRTYTTTHEYQFMHSDAVASVNVVPANLVVGDAYRTPNDIVLTVLDVDLREEYSFQDVMGNEQTRSADPGYQWAFITVDARNEREHRTTLPRREDLTLHHAGEAYDHTILQQKEGAYRARTVDPGSGRTGWIAFEVPEDVAIGELIVEYAGSDRDGPWGATWQA